MIPKLRFKGFTEQWESAKLGDLATVTKLAGFEFTKYVNYSDVGNIIALRGINIDNGELNLNDVKYIDHSDFSKLNRSKLYKGDIVFTYVGTLGKSIIINENDKYYLAPNVALIRIDKNNSNAKFIQSLISTDGYYRHRILPLVTTSSQPALSMESLRKFSITFPNLSEQTKIGAFFAKLDHMINLQQDKLDHLKTLKKGYLQKLFTSGNASIPRLRFKGFTDEWNVKQLKDLADVTMGQSPSSENYTKSNNYDVLVQGNADLKDGQIKPRIFTKEITKLSEFEDLILTVRAPVGALAFNQFKSVVIGRGVASIKPRINRYFIYFDLEHLKINHIWERISSGTTFEAVSSSDVKDLIIDLPKESEEQTKIGTIMNLMDRRIKLQQSKLENLQTLKKGYLQKLFT